MSEQIETVRRFHRLVTARAGALEEHFLGRDRPLGESRVLFEIGSEGATLRELRARLGLDSGYLSRLVQSLERRGLVRVQADEADERVRTVHLTDPGLDEFREINIRSDEVAASLLRPLSDAQRERLVAAMGEVHRYLSLAGLAIEAVDPGGPEAGWCLTRYFGELAHRFDQGFDPRKSVAADAEDFIPPRGSFLVASVDGRPVACGAVKITSPGVGYLKRMWVDSSVRGLGLGRRMLAALEKEAAALGCHTAQLETNQVLAEAIRLYRTSGYAEVPPFNDEIYAHFWFEKKL